MSAVRMKQQSRETKRRFNLFDLLVLLLLAICIAVGAFVMYQNRTQTRKKTVGAGGVLTMTVNAAEAANLAVEDVLYSYDGTQKLGRVIALETEPAGDDGRVVLRATVVWTTGQYTAEGGFSLYGRSLLVGDTVAVTTARFWAEARICSLNLIESYGK